MELNTIAPDATCPELIMPEPISNGPKVPEATTKEPPNNPMILPELILGVVIASSTIFAVDTALTAILPDETALLTICVPVIAPEEILEAVRPPEAGACPVPRLVGAGRLSAGIEAAGGRSSAPAQSTPNTRPRRWGSGTDPGSAHG